jgi:hypothetical protein
MSQSDVKSILDIANIQKQRPMLGQEWDSLLPKLIEFWYWYRGEDIILKQNASVALAASQTAFKWDVALIPSTGGIFLGEEWDILQAWLVDEANKDPADSVAWAIVGDVTNLPLTLFRTGSAITMPAGTTYIYWTFPNITTDISNSPQNVPYIDKIRLRKGRELAAFQTTTATAGNRTISSYVYLRRRQI